MRLQHDETLESSVRLFSRALVTTLTIVSLAGCSGRSSTSDAVAGSGGSSGSGASSGVGASAGAGGLTCSGGASATTPPDPCFDRSGALVPQAKACQSDSDCEPWPTYGCCGPGTIIGFATSARAYEACYPAPTCCPSGLGCYSQASTEDGAQAGERPLEIVLRCVSADGGPGQCRTESAADAGAGVLWACGVGASTCVPAGAP